MPVHESSILLVTLDSCRYDTFAQADTPNLDRVGSLYRAYAPGTFTFPAHASMFVGVTPGCPYLMEPYANPKFQRIFAVSHPGAGAGRPAFVSLEGRNIAEGLKRIGYLTVGTGAVRWFDTAAPTSRSLLEGFDHFWYAGNTFSIRRQLDFVTDAISSTQRPVFVFVNVGETHTPYYHEGASWDRTWNPCLPFGDRNDAEESARRQRACLEFVDGALGPLLERFSGANTVVCADHGDAWGEDGLWEHAIYHEKVMEVPLMFRLQHRPVGAEGGPLARLEGLVQRQQWGGDVATSAMRGLRSIREKLRR